jgi:LAO/AO transport system kinase
VTDAARDPVARGAQLAEALLAGDRRALARLLTAIEGRTPVAEAALRILHPRAGRAHVVGVTGAPGAGKSTLVNAAIRELRRSGRTVAVVAVDPSSPITGGALLGDRVRMQEHASDDGVFIRSMAARGHAGGLAATSGSAVTVLDAAGFDVVLVETVGTGQSEIEVIATADTTVVLEAPEMGDEVQAIKAGLLEVADIVAVSKGDRPGAERTANLLRTMLASAEPTTAAMSAARGPHPKRPEVLLTTGATGAGITELVAAIDRHRDSLDDDALAEARLRRASALVWEIVAERVRGRLAGGDLARQTDALLRDVATHDVDPYAAAEALLSAYRTASARDAERAGTD